MLHLQDCNWISQHDIKNCGSLIVEIVKIYDKKLIDWWSKKSIKDNCVPSYNEMTNTDVIKKSIGNYYSKEHDGQVGEVNRDLIEFVKSEVAYERIY